MMIFCIMTSLCASPSGRPSLFGPSPETSMTRRVAMMFFSLASSISAPISMAPLMEVRRPGVRGAVRIWFANSAALFLSSMIVQSRTTRLNSGLDQSSIATAIRPSAPDSMALTTSGLLNASAMPSRWMSASSSLMLRETSVAITSFKSTCFVPEAGAGANSAGSARNDAQSNAEAKTLHDCSDVHLFLGLSRLSGGRAPVHRRYSDRSGGGNVTSRRRTPRVSRP